MGIARFVEGPPKEPSKVKQLVRTLIEPVIISHRSFYQTNPADMIFIIHVSLILGLTFIGEMVTDLSWLWYAILGGWMLSFHFLDKKIKKAKKKGTKKK